MIPPYTRQHFNRVLQADVLPPSHHSRSLSKVLVRAATAFEESSIKKILSVFDLL